MLFFYLFRPPLNLEQYKEKKYTELPKPGEVFAVKLESGELHRAVRNDFVNKVGSAGLFYLKFCFLIISTDV